MRNTRGFTLIELVIVIVILGILGAVAAPRFINMQGDAYEANVKALKGSIQSAMTLANTKAILNGYDKKGGVIYVGKDFKEVEKDENNKDIIQFVYGFPDADEKGIIRMLQDTESFSNKSDSDSTYILSVDGAYIRAAPRARGLELHEDKKCEIKYTRADKDGVPAKVEAFTKGC